MKYLSVLIQLFFFSSLIGQVGFNALTIKKQQNISIVEKDGKLFTGDVVDSLGYVVAYYHVANGLLDGAYYERNKNGHNQLYGNFNKGEKNGIEVNQLKRNEYPIYSCYYSNGKQDSLDIHQTIDNTSRYVYSYINDTLRDVEVFSFIDNVRVLVRTFREYVFLNNNFHLQVLYNTYQDGGDSFYNQLTGNIYRKDVYQFDSVKKKSILLESINYDKGINKVVPITKQPQKAIDKKTYIFEGKVINEKGKGIVVKNVLLYRTDLRLMQRSIATEVSVSSNGKFKFQITEPGRYEVIFRNNFDSWYEFYIDISKKEYAKSKQSQSLNMPFMIPSKPKGSFYYRSAHFVLKNENWRLPKPTTKPAPIYKTPFEMGKKKGFKSSNKLINEVIDAVYNGDSIQLLPYIANKHEYEEIVEDLELTNGRKALFWNAFTHEDFMGYQPSYESFQKGISTLNSLKKTSACKAFFLVDKTLDESENQILNKYWKGIKTYQLTFGCSTESTIINVHTVLTPTGWKLFRTFEIMK